MRGMLAVLCLGLVAMAGCAGVKPPVDPRQDPYVPRQVQLGSEDLRRHTAFGEPIASRDASGILYIAVPVRAATDLQLYVDYRFSFFDRNGMQLSQTGWLTKTLAPNVFDRVTGNSMSPEAADFQLDLRYAQ